MHFLFMPRTAGINDQNEIFHVSQTSVEYSESEYCLGNTDKQGRDFKVTQDVSICVGLRGWQSEREGLQCLADSRDVSRKEEGSDKQYSAHDSLEVRAERQKERKHGEERKRGTPFPAFFSFIHFMTSNSW